MQSNLPFVVAIKSGEIPLPRFIFLTFGACLLAAFLIWPGRSNAQEALCPISDVLTFDALHDHVDCLANALQDHVWLENIIPGIKITPGVEAPGRDLTFHVSEGCAIVPSYEPSSRSINFQHFLIYYTLNYQQAVLAQLLGWPPAANDEDVVGYFENTLLPALKRERRRCPGSSLQTTGHIPRQLPSILDGTMSREQHERILKTVQNYKHLDALQAYVAFSPTFFVLLHELGHSVLHPDGADGSLAQEMAADEYAAAVMQANKLPVIIGIGLHQIIQSAGRGGDDADLACRIAHLAREYPVGSSFADEFGRELADRLERFRAYYAEHYRQKCTR